MVSMLPATNQHHRPGRCRTAASIRRPAGSIGRVSGGVVKLALTAAFGAFGCGSGVPDECSSEDVAGPGVEAACGRALDARCRAHEGREGCVSEEPYTSDGGEFEYYCEWVRSARFKIAGSCLEPQVTHACIAVVINRFSEEGCPAECSAMASGEDELIGLPCGRDGGPAGGPVDETWVDGATAEERSAVSCSAPDAPAVCDCAAAACSTP